MYCSQTEADQVTPRPYTRACDIAQHGIAFLVGLLLVVSTVLKLQKLGSAPTVAEANGFNRWTAVFFADLQGSLGLWVLSCGIS